MLFILTRNQLSSVVREGREAGATVMEQGVNFRSHFFSLQKYADVLPALKIIL